MAKQPTQTRVRRREKKNIATGSSTRKFYI